MISCQSFNIVGYQSHLLSIQFSISLTFPVSLDFRLFSISFTRFQSRLISDQFSIRFTWFQSSFLSVSFDLSLTYISIRLICFQFSFPSVSLRFGVTWSRGRKWFIPDVRLQNNKSIVRNILLVSHFRSWKNCMGDPYYGTIQFLEENKMAALTSCSPHLIT